MARRKDMKHYPVVRKMQVGQSSPVAANAVADVGILLSKVNHRLYRQSRYYECSVTIDADSQEGATVDVYALADTWYTKKGLMLAKAAWDASNAEEKEMLNGKVARWNDFRVRHGLTGFGSVSPTLFTSGLAQQLFTAGEFDFARVVDQAGLPRTFTWANTPAVNEYSILDEYDASGNTSADPETPATGAYTGLLPNLDAGAAAALQENGNNPPYSATGFYNGIWIKVGTIHLGAGRQRLSTGFFTAPSGYIAMAGVGAIPNAEITIEVKGGDYKGVHAPSMLLFLMCVTI